MCLVLCWDWDIDVLGNAFTVVWMDLNVGQPEQESASSFIFFSLKKVKVIYFFSYCIDIKPAGWEKDESLPTPLVLPVAHSCYLWEAPAVPLPACALGPSHSCIVNKTGEGSSHPGRTWCRLAVCNWTHVGRAERRRGLVTMSAFVTEFKPSAQVAHEELGSELGKQQCWSSVSLKNMFETENTAFASCLVGAPYTNVLPSCT